MVITRYGPPDVLEVQERPDPSPGRGELLIDVRAAGVNFTDLVARSGMKGRKGSGNTPKPPFVPGIEVAGTVAALGEGGDGHIGQRVAAPIRLGGYAERAVVSADGVVPLPDGVGFEAGAAISTNYTVAWEALTRAGNVQPGDRVLVHSAGGGVGIAATQIAKHVGAEVWGTASPGKHEAIRGFGVDHPIDYTRDGWEHEIPKLDLVLDGLGGGSIRRSFRLLRPGGRLVCFGLGSVVSGESQSVPKIARGIAQMPWFHPVGLMTKSKGVIGLSILDLWDEFGSRERWTGPLTQLLADGVIQPVVAQTFTFEHAPDAHRFIIERRNVGKVVLTP